MKTTIVPISGGKDSQVVLSIALARVPREQIVCVHQDTGFDHPLTYKHVEEIERFYNVTIEHTTSKHGDMFGFVEKVQYFPNSAARGCTRELKQEPFLRWLQAKGYNNENCEIWFGMRSDESRDRTQKYGDLSVDDSFDLGDISGFYSSNKKLKESVGCIQTRLPIVTWTTEDVFAHLEAENAPLNPLYGKGHKRVGCYPCLLMRKSEWQLVANDPFGRQNLERLLKIEEKFKAEGNPRKYIKVHRVWDVQSFLDGADVRELTADECGWCSI